MEDVKRILVVSRDTQYDSKAVRYGFSLAVGDPLTAHHSVNEIKAVLERGA
jgi:hypothetical protein